MHLRMRAYMGGLGWVGGVESYGDGDKVISGVPYSW